MIEGRDRKRKGGKPIAKGQGPSLAEAAPSLAAEWHPTKNGKFSPENVSASAPVRAHWVCSKCGNEWCVKVSARYKGSRCPFCAGTGIARKGRSVAEVDPYLVEEWHPEKNGSLAPDQVSFGCARRVWWKCPKCGREWEATVSGRHHGAGCARCFQAGRGWKSLADAAPDIAAEWDPTLNGGKSPDAYSSRSSAIIVWRCPECGREWEASVFARVVRGENCPDCFSEMNRRRADRFVAARGDVMAFWDHAENKEADPREILVSSTRKVGWKCGRGHFFVKSVRAMCRNAVCPICVEERFLDKRRAAIAEQDGIRPIG